MCSSKKMCRLSIVSGRRYGRLRRPRNPWGGLRREARDILYGGVVQGTRVMLASALGQQQMNNEQNPWTNLDATLRTPAAAVGGQAAAKGRGRSHR